jgi:DNA-directed RNA polymerase subunit RPC12/RpoP
LGDKKIMENNKNSGNEKPKYDPENDPTIEEVINEEFGKDNFIIYDDLLKNRNDLDDDEIGLTSEELLERNYLYSWEKKKLDAFKNEYEDDDDLDVFFEDIEKQKDQENFCPICGSDLVLRTRKSDGKGFWGCSGFHKFGCKYTSKFE